VRRVTNSTKEAVVAVGDDQGVHVKWGAGQGEHDEEYFKFYKFDLYQIKILKDQPKLSSPRVFCRKLKELGVLGDNDSGVPKFSRTAVSYSDDIVHDTPVNQAEVQFFGGKAVQGNSASSAIIEVVSSENNSESGEEDEEADGTKNGNDRAFVTRAELDKGLGHLMQHIVGWQTELVAQYEQRIKDVERDLSAKVEKQVTDLGQKIADDLSEKIESTVQPIYAQLNSMQESIENSLSKILGSRHPDSSERPSGLIGVNPGISGSPLREQPRPKKDYASESLYINSKSVKPFPKGVKGSLLLTTWVDRIFQKYVKRDAEEVASKLVENLDTLFEDSSDYSVYVDALQNNESPSSYFTANRGAGEILQTIMVSNSGETPHKRIRPRLDDCPNQARRLTSPRVGNRLALGGRPTYR